MTFKDFLESEFSSRNHYLLLGYPVSHSVSPLMHNTALRHHDIDAQYFAVAVTENDFQRLASHFNSPYFLGANITIPHKTSLMHYVDELSNSANEIGAINTIIKKENSLLGDNTDAYGFLKPLKELSEEIETERAIIFGSGGATKAISFALNDFGFNEVCIVSRRPEALREETGLIVCSYDDWNHYAEDASLIVNATPLGMVPNVEASPVKEDEIGLLAGKICYDIVYNPRETKFIKQANKADGLAIGGLDMLIHQGDASFNKWTAKRFPIGLVKMKLDEHFAN